LISTVSGISTPRLRLAGVDKVEPVGIAGWFVSAEYLCSFEIIEDVEPGLKPVASEFAGTAV
jgi:hypothetical protein